MATVRFPIDGITIDIGVPDDFPREALGRLLRTATNALVAQRRNEARMGNPKSVKRVRAPQGYALGVAGKMVDDWNSGAWKVRLKQANDEEQRLERVAPAADLPSLDAVMPLLTNGHRLADPRLPGWTRHFLGHDLGKCDQRCDACFCFEQGRWFQLCRQLGAQPLSVLNYWRSVEKGGFADATLLTAAAEKDDPTDSEVF